MPVPDQNHVDEQAKAIDRERRRIEDAALLAILLALRLGQAEMVNAILGYGPHTPQLAAARLADSIAPHIADAMVTATLTGRLRSMVAARSVVERIASPGQPVRGVSPLAHTRIVRGVMGPGGGSKAIPVEEVAKRITAQGLHLNPSEAQAIVRESKTASRVVAERIGARALEAGRQASTLMVGSPPATKDAAAAVVRARLDAAGVSPKNPFLVDTLTRTATTKAYEGGVIGGENAPEVSDILWGYSFSAVMDDRTTELCSQLDGMRAPKNDPAWIGRTPMCHWGCRSLRIPLYKGDRMATITDIPPEKAIPPWGMGGLAGLVALL